MRIILSFLLLFSFFEGYASSTKKNIVVIEPSGFGIGYIKATKAKNCALIVITANLANPTLYGYEGQQDATLICNVHDPVGIIEAIEASPYKGCIDAIVAGNEYAHYITAELAAHFGLKSHPLNATLAVRRKDLARKSYEKAHMPNAKFEAVRSLKEAEHAAEKIGYPLILKPSDACASQNIFKVHNHEELVHAIDELEKTKEAFLKFPLSGIFLAEEYVEGPEFSIEILLHEGKIFFASVTEKIAAPPHFVEIMHIVPTTTYKEYQPIMIETAYKAIRALGFTFGPFHVEIRLTDRGPIIIETNGRPGGGSIATDLLVQAFGVNMYELFLDQLLGLPLPALNQKSRGACTAFLTAPKKGFIKGIKGLDRLDVFKYSPHAQSGTLVRPPSNNADRYVQLIVVEDTPELAKKKAIEELQKLSFEYDDD